MTRARETEITEAFVTLASSLAKGYDVVELLSGLTTDCTRLLDIASAGLLLADNQGVLHVMAASSERTRQLELYQLQRAQGPCRDCYLGGEPVSVPDLRDATERWPLFTRAAQAAGFASVHAVPMRLRDNVLGALGLFGTTVGDLSTSDLALGQAMADVASVALIQDRAAADQTVVTQQLQTALNSRVVLEQAKGVIAQLSQLDMAAAFLVMRTYARDHNLRLTAVAEAIVSRALPAQLVIEHSRTRTAGSARDNRPGRRPSPDADGGSSPA